MRLSVKDEAVANLEGLAMMSLIVSSNFNAADVCFLRLRSSRTSLRSEAMSNYTGALDGGPVSVLFRTHLDGQLAQAMEQIIRTPSDGVRGGQASAAQ